MARSGAARLSGRESAAAPNPGHRARAVRSHHSHTYTAHADGDTATHALPSRRDRCNLNRRRVLLQCSVLLLPPPPLPVCAASATAAAASPLPAEASLAIAARVIRLLAASPASAAPDDEALTRLLRRLLICEWVLSSVATRDDEPSILAHATTAARRCVWSRIPTREAPESQPANAIC